MLDAEDQPALRTLAAILRHYRGVRVEVHGHTDSVGTDPENQELSEQRAMNVASLLISNGFPREEIIAVGFGERQPLRTNASEAGRATNNRVEIHIEGNIN
jgi:OmpA-OmpF porin, OOP family